MVKQLVSRSEFARLAGVSAAAVTKACDKKLKAAVSGKRIDVNHPIAVAYLQKKSIDKTPPLAPGLDPAYQAAVDFCRESGNYTVTPLIKKFKMDHKRAKAIVDTMRAGSLIPAKGLAPPPPPAEPAPHTRGHTAKNEKLKAASAPDPGAPQEIPDNILAFADMTLRDLVRRFGTDTAFADWLKAVKGIEAIDNARVKTAQLKGQLVSRDLVKIGVIDQVDATHRKLLSDGAKTIAKRLTAMIANKKGVADCEVFVHEQISSFIRPMKARIARALKNA